MPRAVFALALAAVAAPALAAPPPYASIREMQAAAPAVGMVSEALRRMEAIDRRGPRLNSVLSVNPHALADAQALDYAARAGQARGPLFGVPILLKDNIDSADGLATTAGSLALTGNVTGRDAPIVRRLRAAGAVIVGKANLSEWANFRSTNSISGWSAAGGLVRNPYALDRLACGSSAGSAAAVAAGIVPAAIGTETDGSITCPAAMNGVVGLKPTVGLVSRTFIVPISPEQDTAGPIARTVTDAALILSAIAGSDPADPATAQADGNKADYAAGLKLDALRGARLGVLRSTAGRSPQTDKVFALALEALRAAGAVLVEIKDPDAAVVAALSQAETDALRAEFRPAVNAYLASTPPSVRTRSLDALIAFNAAEPREIALFGQEIFEAAARAPGLADPAAAAARGTARRLATQLLDGMLATGRLDAIVAESGGPASAVDPVNGAKWLGSPSTLPAVAGYPHLTVPMGQVSGLPVGLSFIGPAWSEARLLALGFSFEQATRAWRPPLFLPSVAVQPGIAGAFDPR